MTSHVDYLGLFLWANKTLFSHISLRPIYDISNITNIELPHSKPATDNTVEDSEFDNDEDEASLAQIEHLATLSLTSNSRWQNILDIDIIQKRNKPKAVVKNNTSAPFFLPTLPTLELQFDLSGLTKQNQDTHVNLNKFNNLTVFARLLASVEDDNYEPVIQKLKQMGPSAIRQEILLFSPSEVPANHHLVIHYLKLVNSMFLSNQNIELAQAYLAVFIKVYTDYLSSNNECVALIQDVRTNQAQGWNSLKKKILYSLSIIDFKKK